MSTKRDHSEAAMAEYFNALLFEEETVEFDNEPVKRLLEQATPKIQAVTEEERVSLSREQDLLPLVSAKTDDSYKEPEVETVIDISEVPEPPPEPLPDAMSEYMEQNFQALFFKVAGLTLAVPLKSLGGIHQLGKVSPLMGKPEWFRGIMTERDNKLQVVDTARWVMPEKCTPELEESLDYQYLITLNDSPWGLLCEELVTSEPLQPQSIQWRKETNHKRPWLAGVVRDRMCALLDVNALITLLDNGLGHIQQD